ncbi:LamG-like jellyroll fold domain-containing protein [Thalassoglobus sp.]|uniref:LamG-like jellyroll fold domain-containing protein n=1 Tax=Thalassoglobus sp. TaxID=2795869 RepID=UPI003AA87DD0
MSEKLPGADEQSVVVNNLIVEYMKRTDSGENITPEEFIAEHAEYTEELKRHFDNVNILKDLQDRSGTERTVAKPTSKPDETAAQTVLRGTADSETSVTRRHSAGEAAATNISIPEKFGRYSIQKVLGQGAMGAVYLAKDTQLDRDVALKIPKFGDLNQVDEEEMLARFYREARAAATLRSPNICPVYDVGEIDGQHYITMAYIAGRPLKDFTKSKKSHSEKQIATTIRKLAVGLAQAHKIGVVHRDLKPANIMVDQHGEPVVMDFGLARRSSSDDVQVTQSGAILGTPAYMSPEQVEGNQAAIGPQADIYALGIIMYELITGEMPYKGSLMSILQQIGNNNPAKPSELRANIDPRLENICLKMMAGDLKKRYSSMNEVAADLQDVLRNPNKKQKKAQGRKNGPKPAAISSAHEESNPALISIEQPKPYAEQLRKKKIATTSKTTPKPAGKETPSTPNKNLLIAGGLGGLILLLGIVFIVRIGKYDVQITLDDPGIQLSVDGEEVVIKNGQDIIKLSAGKHQLQLKKAGLTTHVEEFTVTKNGKTSLRAVVLHNNQLDGLLNGEQPAAIEERLTGGPVENSEPESITPDGSSSSKLTQEEDTNSLVFDGQNDYVELHLSDSLKDRLSTEKPVTVEAWIWSANNSGKRQFIFNSGVSTRLEILREGESFGEHLANTWTAYRTDHKGNWDRVVSSRITPSGQWTHVAVVWQTDLHGYKSTFYINGNSSQLERSHKAGRTQTPTELRAILGAAPGSDGHSIHTHFKGKIRDFRISDAARYQEDFKPEQNLVADEQTALLFKMNEGFGDILEDSSDNGHHGKIVGAKWVRNDETEAKQSSKPLTALVFDGTTSRVEVPGLKLSGSPPLTIEGWVTPSEKGTSNVIIFHDGVSDPLTLQVGGIRRWEFGGWWSESNKRLEVFGPKIEDWERRTHIAGQWNGQSLQLFIDGKLVQERDYSGSFNPQGSLEIGGHDGSRFKGSIDEIRISKTLRYQTDFIPQNELTSDEETLALYHFNEGTGNTLKDSSGNGHNGKIVGAKWAEVTEHRPVSQTGLDFDGKDDWVTIPTLEFDGSHPITLEAYVRLRRTDGTTGIVSNQNGGGIGITTMGGDSAGIVLAQAAGKSRALYEQPIPIGQRLHVAGTWDQKQLKFFVDGKLVSTADAPQGRFSNGAPHFALGAYPAGVDGFLDGIIDEVRISGDVRYTEDFTPADRLTKEDQTLALYHFDEGIGNTLEDSSGNGHHGEINGAKWVNVEANSAHLAPAPATINYAISPAGDLDKVGRIAEFPRFIKLDAPMTIELTITPFSHVAEKEHRTLVSFAGALVLKQHHESLTWMRSNQDVEPAWEEVRLQKLPLHKPLQIAVVSTGKQLRLFVDGKLLGVQDLKILPSSLSSRIDLNPWSTKGSNHLPFDGTIDEIRFSNFARYDSDYIPTERLTADKQTVALYHCDEGTGDVLKDSSDNGHHATILNAKWGTLEE